METIIDICKRCGISTAVYYKIAHKIGKRPDENDIEIWKQTRKHGRPRKTNF